MNHAADTSYRARSEHSLRALPSRPSDLPAEGDTIIIDETFGEIESVKSVSELHAPLSGEIVEVNTALEDSPETVNEDAYGGGWMIKVRPTDVSELDVLMSSDDYEAFLEEA